VTNHVDVRDLIPATSDLDRLREIASTCNGCDLYRNATQTVFGEGPRSAGVMLVGEQPGDQEDKQGHPFVGPAGRILNDGLDEAGISRGSVYVTNVVKHFKWQERGKRRIHKKPNLSEISACRPWLEAEIEVVSPRALVCLGATAAQALLGKSFRVSRSRGRPVDSELAPLVMATVHPSSILRAPGDERTEAYRSFVSDLGLVARVLAGETTG
jgi:uracil-DNA glycosylase family protein